MAHVDQLIAFGLGPEIAKALGWTPSTATAAGSAITDATGLSTKLVLVSGANGTKGVKIPQLDVGEMALVKNADNAVLKVYPASSTNTFNSGSAGAAVSIAAYAGCFIVQRTAADAIALEAPAA